jgi:RNA polymerase sigma-70 factor, ECF subfamily
MNTTTSHTDNELLAAIQQNDALALQELYLRYFRKIKSYAYHHLKSNYDAEDVTQNVFRIVLGEKKILNFRGECKLGYWLMRITRNQCISLQRKRKPELLYDSLEIQHCLNSANVKNKASIEQEYTYQQIRNTLSKLPSNYQSVLYLFYFENIPCEKIAEILKRPVGTVCVYLSRGRDKMKQHITRGKHFQKT